jgi:hypothetical protein
MDNEKFTAVLALMIPQIIQLLMDTRKIDNMTAAGFLYNSGLYEMLENEQSKLWHLSPLSLYNLLEEELHTGTVVYPQEA